MRWSSIPCGTAAAAAEFSHGHLHSLVVPKMLWELGLLAQAQPALCQTPPPAELPELFWAGSAKAEVVSGIC